MAEVMYQLAFIQIMLKNISPKIRNYHPIHD